MTRMIPLLIPSGSDQIHPHTQQAYGSSDLEPLQHLERLGHTGADSAVGAGSFPVLTWVKNDDVLTITPTWETTRGLRRTPLGRRRR